MDGVGLAASARLKSGMLRRRVDGVMLAASLQAQVRRCSDALKAAISMLAFLSCGRR